MAISLFLGGVEACQYDLWYLRTLKMVTIKSAKKRCTEMTTLADTLSYGTRNQPHYKSSPV